MNPFDIAKELSGKRKTTIDSENEAEYGKNAYMINRIFALYTDTIMYANDVNINYHLDPQLQYDYYYNGIRKGNRYSPWVKKEKDDDIKNIQKYFGYNMVRAKEAKKILTKKQLNYIKKAVNPE